MRTAGQAEPRIGAAGVSYISIGGGPRGDQDRLLAARGALAGAALFVALIIGFSSLGDRAPSAPLLLLLGVVGALSHLVLLPLVAFLAAPRWARIGGFAWIAIDVMLNVATVNGLAPDVVAPLRLGGHVMAGLWIVVASAGTFGLVRAVGLLLGALLTIHAFTSPWIPPWVLFIPFMLVPIWLALAGRFLLGRPVAET